jgi:rod shape-determining protein MreD
MKPPGDRSLGAVVLQVALARHAVGGRFVFDIVLVGGVSAPQAGGGGMLAGTIGGLLQDVLSGGVVGLAGLVKTLVGYAAGAMGTHFVVAKAHARALIVAVASLVSGLMSAGLQGVIAQSWPRVSWPGMLEAIVINTAVGWLAFQLAESVPGAVARGRSRRRSSWGRRQW